MCITSQTGGQPYSDTSPNEVSECSLFYKNSFKIRHFNSHFISLKCGRCLRPHQSSSIRRTPKRQRCRIFPNFESSPSSEQHRNQHNPREGPRLHQLSARPKSFTHFRFRNSFTLNATSWLLFSMY